MAILLRRENCSHPYTGYLGRLVLRDPYESAGPAFGDFGDSIEEISLSSGLPALPISVLELPQRRAGSSFALTTAASVLVMKS